MKEQNTTPDSPPNAKALSSRLPALAADPLGEVRTLKRWVRIGVYAAIFGSEPLYIFVLHMSMTQVVVGLLVGLVIAFTAIEGAFAQMFKLRKRSAYPNVLLVELGSVSGVSEAVQNGLETIQRLLKSGAGFVALGDPQGEWRLAATNGVPGESVDALLRCLDYARPAGKEMVTRTLLPQEALLGPGRLVLAPVTGLQETMGVLGIVGRRGDVKDDQLLLALGSALGLSLENLIQKEELCETLSILSTTLDASADGILAIDPSLRMESFNAKFLEMWRIPEEMAWRRDGEAALNFAMQQVADPEAFLATVREFIADEEAEGVGAVEFKDGRVIEFYSTPRRVNGAVIGRLVSFRDVSARKRAEGALRETEERNRLILENALDAIVAMDGEGKITTWNPQAERTFGWTRAEAMGRKLAELIVPLQHRWAHKRGLERYMRTGKGKVLNRRIEITALHKSGREFPVELAISPSVGGDGVSFSAFVRDITERKKAEELLRQSEELYRDLVENVNEIIFELDSEGMITYISHAVQSVTGFSPEELISRPGRELVHPDDLPTLQQDATAGHEFRLLTRDGEYRWMRSSLQRLEDEGQPAGVRGILVDITERKQAEDALRASEEKYRNLVNTAQDAIYTVSPTGELMSLNAAFEKLTGWSTAEWIGKPFAPIVHPEDLPVAIDILQRVLAGETASFELRIKSKSGEYLIAEFSAAPLVEDGQITGLLGVGRDVTERRKAQDMIRQLAYHDALTGLPNRALFEDRLRVALAQAQRQRQMVAVMFLDVDRFKLVNDTLGHTGGDTLLRAVAEELSGVIREGDTVARVGGDEFTLLLPAMSDETDALAVAERILETFKRPRFVDGQEFSVTTSIGITIFPQDGSDVDTLLRNADTAMYRAKERGRDNFQLYTPAMNAAVIQRLALENDLRHAVERGELFLRYQPVSDVSSGQIVGAEALLRWEHPQRGTLDPDSFIPLAEETGLIVPVGEWVLREACLQAKTWHDAGLPIRIGVNLSVRQLHHKDLIRLVTSVLDESGVAPEMLQLEITEGDVMSNVEFIIGVLHGLRAMGVGISVDDFGTGYSSLSYLKRFPIDSVKIDRSFVRDLATDPSDAAIVTTVIAMARNLSLRVVAEGVETNEQLEFLRLRNCDEYQGYLISRPVPAHAFARLLSAGQSRRAKVTRLRSR
jgi:diguanylate cyclase (GGDEF)-like protein/PAS domain S-box-containing protein